MADATATIGLNTTPLQASANKAVAIIGNMGNKMTASVASLSASFTGLLAGGAIVGGLISLGKSSIIAADNIDRLQRSLANAMGSAEGAAREMDNLREAAKLPGVDLEAAVRGSSRLQTLGLSAGQARNLLIELGNVASLEGLNSDDVREMIDAIVDMGSASEISDDKVDRLTERSALLSKVLKDTFGASTAVQLRDLGVTADQLINSLSGGLSKLNRAPVDTLTQNIKNFNAELQSIKETLGTELLPLVNQFLSTLPAFFTGAKEVAKDAGDYAKALALYYKDANVAVKAFGATAPGTALRELDSRWKDVQASIAKTREEQEQLNAKTAVENRIKARTDEIQQSILNKTKATAAAEEAAVKAAIAAADIKEKSDKEMEANTLKILDQQAARKIALDELKIQNATLNGENKKAQYLQRQLDIYKQQRTLMRELNLDSDTALKLAQLKVAQDAAGNNESDKSLSNSKAETKEEEKRGKIRGVRYSERESPFGKFRGERQALNDALKLSKALPKEKSEWSKLQDQLKLDRLNRLKTPSEMQAQANATETIETSNSSEFLIQTSNTLLGQILSTLQE